MFEAAVIPSGLTLAQLAESINTVRLEVEAIDLTVNQRYQEYCAWVAPFAERRGKLMQVWQSLYELQSDMQLEAALANMNAEIATDAIEQPGPQEPPSMSVAAKKKERQTPRSVMLDLLRASIGPVSAWDLAQAVQRAGIQTKMTGAELVYQTLYAARNKAGHPIERNEDGSWHWIRDNAA